MCNRFYIIHSYHYILDLDSFTLRAGSGILIGVAAISSFFINKHFRYKLKVGHYGRGSSYLAVIGTPAMIGGLIHYTVREVLQSICNLISFEFSPFHISQWIQPKILLNEYDCPVCIETRAGLTQAAIATVWPFILGPLTSFMLATRYFTYRLPSLTEKPKEILSLYLKFTKSARNLGLSLFAINMLAGMFITSMEISEYTEIMKTMLEHDRKIDDGIIPLDVDFDGSRVVQKLKL